MMVFASGWKWRSPEAIDSELLYSDQFSLLDTMVTAEPDRAAVLISRRLNFLASLAISNATAAWELEVTFSLSSKTTLSSLSISASFTLTEPISMPKEWVILY